MLNNLQWDSLESRRQKSRIAMMDKITKGKVAIDPQDYLSPGITRTRSANSKKYRSIGARTVVYKNSFFPCTIPQWNNTSDSTVSVINEDLGVTTTSD